MAKSLKMDTCFQKMSQKWIPISYKLHLEMDMGLIWNVGGPSLTNPSLSTQEEREKEREREN